MVLSWSRAAGVAAALLSVGALGLSACTSPRPTPPPQPTGPPDLSSPLVAYHGMILDGQNRPIPLTPQNAERLLERFSNEVAAASPEAAAQYRSKAGSEKAFVEASPSVRLAARIRVANWLLTQPSTPQSDRSRDMLALVAGWARGLPAGPLTPTDRLGLDKLGPEEVLPPTKRTPPATYLERCRDESVPRPPDWGSPDWKLQGVLDPAHVFAGSGGQQTQVWAYADPAKPGACIALPRRDAASGDIALLGIICQSKTTGKACFWDNIDRKTGQRMGAAASAAFKIEDVQDGDLLSENCTNCHRGPNVFIISPDTMLDLANYDTEAAVRYTPVSTQTTWGNPGPKIAEGTRPCARCHEIPEFGENNNTVQPALGSSYCRILARVVDTTMPNLARPAGWAAPNATYKVHVDAFRTECDGP